jgi:hypothetical protein
MTMRSFPDPAVVNFNSQAWDLPPRSATNAVTDTKRKSPFRILHVVNNGSKASDPGPQKVGFDNLQVPLRWRVGDMLLLHSLALLHRA